MTTPLEPDDAIEVGDIAYVKAWPARVIDVIDPWIGSVEGIASVEVPTTRSAGPQGARTVPKTGTAAPLARTVVPAIAIPALFGRTVATEPPTVNNISAATTGDDEGSAIVDEPRMRPADPYVALTVPDTVIAGAFGIGVAPAIVLPALFGKTLAT